MSTRPLPQLTPHQVRVAVILPVRNEAGNIAEALRSVLNQDFDPDRLEILVVDGTSNDETVTIARTVLAGRANSRILANPEVTIPSGMNVGIAATDADVVVRVDGHCRLDPTYVSTCVRLLAESGAANVGGLMRPRGQGPVGQAMALALCSRFGIGDSRFHYSDREELVETVYLGAFRRVVLNDVGGYDQTMLSNEDFELNHRIVAAGYKILLSPEIRSTYIPRNSIAAIGKQFFRYGLWKSQVMQKHPDSIRPRHLVAPVLAAVLAASLPAFAITGRKRYLAPSAVYGSAVALAAARTARPRTLFLPLMTVFPTMHLSWGTGVLVGFTRSRCADLLRS